MTRTYDRLMVLARDGSAKMDADLIHAASDVRRLEAENERLRAALRDVIGMLDDPTGDEHVRDMRGATVIARAALKEGER